MSFRTRYEEKSYSICNLSITNRIRFLTIVRNDNRFIIHFLQSSSLSKEIVRKGLPTMIRQAQHDSFILNPVLMKLLRASQ
jgi:hypothetical protein